MIVKDEANNLYRCLQSVQPYITELIVVDTGSTDSTIDIARQFNARIEHFTWIDDFAAARNYSISFATKPWILVLDADEELIVNNSDFSSHLNQSVTLYKILLSENSDKKNIVSPVFVPRIIRNIPGIHYESRFHEQLVLPPNSVCKNLEDIQIYHYGYASGVGRNKIENRDIPILEKIRQQDGLSLMLLYALTHMYKVTGQLEKARECYQEGVERLLPNLMSGDPLERKGFIPALLTDLIEIYLSENKYELVQLLCRRGLSWFCNYPPLIYLAGIFMVRLEYQRAALVYFRKCIDLGILGNYYTAENFDLRYINLFPLCAIGEVYKKLGDYEQARTHYRQALRYDQGNQLIVEKLREIGFKS